MRNAKVANVGSASQLGTSRKRNEDRFTFDMNPSDKSGMPYAYLGVFDGHGGFATSQWLTDKLQGFILEAWKKNPVESALRRSFISADKELLSPKGFMGMGERGVGGSKCGSTAAAALVYKDKAGSTKLVAANCGDARVLVCVDGQPPMQLTIDHVPDTESERVRIESQNPNPKLPLVKYVGGTWRVGGLLALSRAFGDAYMKASGFNEGVGSGYSSGFGVIATPDVEFMDLDKTKGWLVVSSDGLNTNEERGGGGGLDNAEVAKMCKAAGARKDPNELAKELVKGAVAAGSTDDVTVLCVRLQELV